MSEFAIGLHLHGLRAAGPRVPAALTNRGLAVLGDRRLSRLAAEGAGELAFAAIYARYHQPLYRYCHSIVRDADDAADALQSAMLKAFLALPAKKPEATLKPWLFRIVHNEAISVIRRRPCHESITDANVPRAPTVDDEADSRGRLAELVDDLQQLEERQRAALVMRELNGLEYDEIASAFGTTPAAAKQTVYEARLALHARAEGRAMSCEPVRAALSAGDRRKLRARTLRAHLRACAECRRFESAIVQRRGDFAALSPALPAQAAGALLKGILGGSGGAQGGAGAGLGAAANLAGMKAVSAALTLAAGVAAIGTAVDRAAPRPAPDTTVPAALTRPAPPLTNIYALSTGRIPVAQLTRPAALTARSAPIGPVGGRAAARSRARSAAGDTASGPRRPADAPFKIPPRLAAGSSPAEGAASPAVTPPAVRRTPVAPPSVPDLPMVAVPAPVALPAAPPSPAVQLPQLPSRAPVRVPPAHLLP